MDKKSDIELQKLTDAEEQFCYLYVFGGMEFAGQSVKCYEDIFGETNNVSVVSKRFVSQPHILTRINELFKVLQSETETAAIKLQISETLKGVMEETATSQFSDKWGVSLSPAPLRAVSVNAAKALMELYPVKHAHETKLKIEGEGGVVFNVIVPNAPAHEKD